MDDHSLKLLGLYRAEFEAAKGEGRVASASEWLTGGCAVSALFSVRVDVLYTLAIISLLAGTFALVFRVRAAQRKGRAEKGRRAVLIAEGMWVPISGKTYADLRAGFSSVRKNASRFEDPNYYASASPPGPERLASMIEESAFWTKWLSRTASQLSWAIAAAFLLISLLLLLIAIPAPALEDRTRIAHVSFLALSILFARNHIGDAISLRAASEDAEAVDDELNKRHGAQSPEEADVFRLLGDYNCALESCPLIPSLVYRWRKAELNELWKERVKRV